MSVRSVLIDDLLLPEQEQSCSLDRSLYLTLTDAKSIQPLVGPAVAANIPTFDHRIRPAAG